MKKEYSESFSSLDKPKHYNNSLNTVKFLAAIQVMYLHTLVHLNITDISPYITMTINFFMGVPIFFSLSGFFIWLSIGRSKTFKEYIRKRFIRIYPELWIAILVEVLAIVVLYWEKIEWGRFIAFIIAQSSILQFWTPDFLREYGCGTPNGSLWTIGIIIQFYVVAYFLFKIMHGRGKKHWIIMFITFVVIKTFSAYLPNYIPVIFYKLFSQTLIPHFWLFILGAFIAEYSKEIIPIISKYWYIFIIASLLVGYFNLDLPSESYGVFLYSLRVIGLIGFGYKFPMFDIKNDVSYGIYIYHMTVVNIMIEFGIHGGFQNMIFVILITLGLAYCSNIISKYISHHFKRT